MLIRPATPADAPAIARIHVATWHAAYRGQVPDALLASLDVNRYSAGWMNRLQKNESSTCVTELENELVGFCTWEPSSDKDADPKQVSDLVALYISPQHWRQGTGRSLIEHAFNAIRGGGCSDITLWVLTTNTPSRKFYEAMGFAPDGATKLQNFSGHDLHETRYRRAL